MSSLYDPDTEIRLSCRFEREGQFADTSLTDSQGHSYSELMGWTLGGSAGAGATISVRVTRVTTALTNSDNLTVQFSAAVAAKVVGAQQPTPTTRRHRPSRPPAAQPHPTCGATRQGGSRRWARTRSILPCRRRATGPPSW